jgi:hypothetical protein
MRTDYTPFQRHKQGTGEERLAQSRPTPRASVDDHRVHPQPSRFQATAPSAGRLHVVTDLREIGTQTGHKPSKNRKNVVNLTFASWNLIGEWLERLEALRQAR